MMKCGEDQPIRYSMHSYFKPLLEKDYKFNLKSTHDETMQNVFETITLSSKIFKNFKIKRSLKKFIFYNFQFLASM